MGSDELLLRLEASRVDATYNSYLCRIIRGIACSTLLLLNPAAKSQAEYLNHVNRTAGNGQKHCSICMDGTDVDFGKYMTAAFHWPEIDMACWAPPMDRA